MPTEGSRRLILTIPNTPRVCVQVIAMLARINLQECRVNERLRVELGRACAPGGFALLDDPIDRLRDFAILAEEDQRPIAAKLEEVVASAAAWLNLREPRAARVAVRASRRGYAHAWLVLRDGTPIDPAVNAGMPRPPDDVYDAPDAIVSIDG
jgi:hypothetical protein